MKRLLLTTIAMLFVATGFVTYVSLSENEVDFQNYDIKGIYKSLNHFHTVMADENGEIKDEYFFKARRQADALKAASNKTANEILEWEELGPNNVGGRTRSVLIDKNDSNLVYAGSVGGGLWISRNGADTWEEYAFNTELPVLAIGTITQTADGTVWWSSGEPTHGDAAGGTYGGFMPGEGVFKLSGPDAMFEQVASTIPSSPNNPATEWSRINRLTAHPTNPDILFAALDNFSVKMTTNGGNSWSTPGGLPENGNAFDIEIGSEGSIAYTVIAEKIFKSTNGGSSFTEISDLINLITDRKEIAISPTDNNFAYISHSSSSGRFAKCHQTKDGGNSWTVIGTYDEDFLNPFTVANTIYQGWYDHALAVDPANPERIFLGGVSLWSWSSDDGWRKLDNFGNSVLNPFYIHADKHTIVFDGNDPERMFVGGDGGVFRSTNAGSENPFFIPRNKNYNVTQFYAVGADYLGRVTAGAQDNGTSYIDYQGTSQLSANLIGGGDGGYTDISDIDPNVIFASSQWANFRRSPNAGESFGSFLGADCSTNFLGTLGVGDGVKQFIHPYILWEDLDQYLDTQDDDVVIKRSKFISGGQKLFCGFDALNPSGIVACQLSAPGFNGRIGDFGVTGGRLSALSITADGDIMWAASSNGNLIRAKGLNEEGGQPGWEYDLDGFINSFDVATFSNNYNDPPWGARYVTGLSCNPESKNEVIATLGSFNNENNIYITENAQISNPVWESIQANLPEMPIYSAIFDATDDDRIIAATEMGIWVYDRDTEQWTEENDGIGRVRVVQVRQEPMRDMDCPVIYIATHGRGVFRAANLAKDMDCNTDLPVYVLGTEEQEIIAESSVNIYPNPMVNQSKLQFNLDQPSEVSVRILSLNGQLMQTYQFGKMSNGTQTVDINKGDMPIGNYIVSIITEQNVVNKKLTVGQ